MREEAVKLFLYELGCDSLEANNHWMNCKCPMAAYTHEGGVDSAPSFGISCSDENRSVYYCFGCMPEPRSLSWLLHNLFVMTGRYPWDAAKIFRAEENHSGTLKKIKIPDPWSERPIESNPIPYEVLRKVPLLQTGVDFEARRCRWWLEQERQIPVWTQNLCRVRYMGDSSCVVFPLTDISGNVFLMRMRSRKQKYIRTVTPEMLGFEDMEFPRLKYAGAWFGMFLIDWSRPVMLVEAEIDMLRVISLGFFNVIASATSSVTDAQIDALHASTYLLGYDDDKAGRHAHARIIDRIGEKATMFRLKWKLSTNKDGEPCKDAGELIDSDELQAVLCNRELVV